MHYKAISKDIQLVSWAEQHCQSIWSNLHMYTTPSNSSRVHILLKFVWKIHQVDCTQDHLNMPLQIQNNGDHFEELF